MEEQVLIRFLKLTQSERLSLCHFRRELWRQETALVIEACSARVAAQLWDDRYNLAECAKRLNLSQRILIVRHGKLLYPAIHVSFVPQDVQFIPYRPLD